VDTERVVSKRTHRWRLALVLVPIGLFTIASNVGGYGGPAIVAHHPLLEMFLNPSNRYLALAANRVDTGAYYLVGFLRLTITDPFFYLLGLWYGDRALAWIKRRSVGSARAIERGERWFAKARYPIVFIAPNGIVCLLAGAIEMPVLPFALLNIAGTIARLAVIKVLAHVFNGPLASVNRFVDRYQWWLVGLSLAVGMWQFQRRRAAPSSRSRPNRSPDR
jgi:membrane protein DedA with SNARE-associated domain